MTSLHAHLVIPTSALNGWCCRHACKTSVCSNDSAHTYGSRTGRSRLGSPQPDGSLMEPIHTLTPIGLFVQAGPVGKAVLLTLLAASVWCWVLIIEAAFGIRRLNRAIGAAGAEATDAATALLDPIIDAG